MQQYVLFEQPLSEHIRICLRIEHLLNRIEASILGETETESRTALESMLEMINVIDRPDLRSKLTRALTQHATLLTQLEQKEEIDHKKLQATLTDLDHLIDKLYNLPDAIGQQLRHNSFLNTIRQHMANPGGACPFGAPAYFLWLQQPSSTRISNLLNWFSTFEHLKTAVTLLLHLTRGSRKPERLLAEQGFYQCALDPRLVCHLVRVAIPLELNAYPEISLGRHRLVIRFLEFNLNDKAAQRAGEVSFELTCCFY